MSTAVRAGALAIAMLAALPAAARDIWIGAFRNGVDLPTSNDTLQGGTNIELGYRFDRIAGLGFIGGPAPYLIASINTAGDTSFAGGGVGWNIGLGPLYARPGIGLVVQDKWHRKYDGPDRIDLGSPVLFEPELSLGWRFAPRLALEASWVHTSHATLFSHQNPGLDRLGARLIVHLP